MGIARSVGTAVTVESLSRRCLLADISASMDGGRLLLQSSDSDIKLVIERQASDSANALRVRGVNGTSVNGHPVADFAAPRKGIRVHFTGGATHLTFSNVRIQSGLSIMLGEHENAVLLRKLRVTGSVSLDGGIGTDHIYARDVVVQRDFIGSGGEDRDDLSLRRMHVAGEFRWIDRSGASRITLEQLIVGEDAALQTSNARDRVTILDNSFGQRTEINTFGGDDYLSIRGSQFASNPFIHDGPGEDKVNREIFFRWDFANATQGWDGGFADYTLRSVAGEDPLQKFRMEKGLGIISDGGPLGGQQGYRMSSENSSDDMFMFLTRKLSRSDGIRSDASYRAEYEVSFASATAAGLIGAGGAPAEAVILKAGGVGYLPRVVYVSASNDWQLNIDKANQSASSPDSDLTNLGDITNGNVAVLPDVYRRVVRRAAHVKPITASSDGNLWLIVGTDSGFEGPTTLFYLSITVRLIQINEINTSN